MRSVAIVGSGPAGCYTAQALTKAWPDAAIIVYDRLDVPFGLIRYGVAPDHQGTKAIALQFDRLFSRNNVRFAGGVEVGRDVSLDQLRDQHDVVVLATGLSGDRRVGIPGEERDRVYGSGQVTRYFNGHPAEAHLNPDFGENVVVIGAGNVSMDIVRLLAKGTSARDDERMPESARALLSGHRVRRLTVVSRSAPAEAKFDPAMLRELTRIDGVRFAVEGLNDTDESPRGEAVAEMAALAPPDDPRVVVEFCFGRRPSEIVGQMTPEYVRVLGSDGSSRSIAADSVITAVGFCEAADQPLPLGSLLMGAEKPAGRIAAGLYRVGWARRGPTGTIPDNRMDAREVAQAVVADFR